MQEFYYTTIDSTQNQAKRLIDDGAISKQAYIVAEEQTAGRGQYGKCWASPRGAGIYMSVVTLNVQRSTFDAMEDFVASYTINVAEKLINALNTIYRTDYYIKPINDVYYNDCKLAGILVEIYKGYIITGIGINTKVVARTIKESLVDQPKAPPISLEEIFPVEIFQKFQAQVFINSLANLVIRDLLLD